MSNDLAHLTFEQALRALEETAVKLESGDLSLEESLTLYEQGQKLAAFCTQQLDHATLRVEQLTTDGEIVEIGD
ncbi:MAG: exodeoxyribonuclease VII small subunit [Anaerolineales bacterium]|nr:exodeoxyribonuclease VII small subunit [Anaerolineales bacterium]